MLRTLFRNKAGEGVASWVPFAAIVAVLALIMSMLALTPSQALAEEAEPTGASTTERVDETSDADTPPQEEPGAPTETEVTEPEA